MTSTEARLHALDVSFVAAEKDRDGCEAERRRISARLEVAALEAGGLEGQGGEVAGERAEIEQHLAAAQRLGAERRGELSQRQLRPLPLARGIHRRRAAADRGAVRAAAIAERLHATEAQAARCSRPSPS
jgi:hypothetical protein